MNEKLIELLEVLKDNEELQMKFCVCESLGEIYEASTKYVDGYTLQEFKSGLEMLLMDQTAVLSDAELDMVAGGTKVPSSANLPIDLFNSILNSVDGLSEALAKFF